MKKSPLFLALLGAVALLAPAGAMAQPAPGPKARIFAKYDTNKNSVIDGDEIAAVRKAFAAEPKGEFANYDLDHDGKLDDKEIAGIKPPGAKKDGAKKGGGKQKAEPKEQFVGRPLAAGPGPFDNLRQTRRRAPA